MPEANREGPRSIRIPESHLELYGEMLNVVYDIPPEAFSGIGEDLILSALMCRHWSSVLAMGALRATKHKKAAMAPGRKTLITGIRTMDPVKTLWGLEECLEANDGLPEVAEQWALIRSMYEPRGNA